MEYTIKGEYLLGDIVLIYYENKGIVSTMIVPTDYRDKVSEKKLTLIEPMVQISLRNDRYIYPYARGLSMRNTQTAYDLTYIKQTCETIGNTTQIVTKFKGKNNLIVKHHMVYRQTPVLESYVTVENNGVDAVDIRMLASFSLNGITPFDDDDAHDTLHMHRMRSYWSAEGRQENSSIEDVMLDMSWSKWATKSERFGQVGTLPVRKYFPFIGIEDTKNNVTWGANIAWGGSWQMEAYRRQENLAISGGLADYEFGHWNKILNVGEKFTTPSAYITVCQGGIDDVCNRLLEHQQSALMVPSSEESLPIIYNEYCDTWNHPTEQSIKKQLEALKGMGTEYFVIDAGWFQTKLDPNISDDWEVNEKAFPNGLQYTVDNIREAGMLPGIWFEFECAHINSEMFKQYPDFFIKEDGQTVISTNRAFWDFSKPEVIDYLKVKVVDFLKQYGFSYLKIDYNDTVGYGIDGPATSGENLCNHVKGVYKFLELIKQEIPEIVIENCASGGHRLEPKFMNITSMSSFSDAHETKDIPIIAADLHNLVLPKQSQIWVVFRKDDDIRRIQYSLANSFLGRMCLSGPIYELEEERINIVKQAISLYRKVHKIIKEGRSFVYRSPMGATLHTTGWQVVVRESSDRSEALVICHRFAENCDEVINLPIDFLGGYEIADSFGCADSYLTVSNDCINVHIPNAYSAKVFHLIKK